MEIGHEACRVKRSFIGGRAGGGQGLPEFETTLSDQEDVSVTIYNSNLALVRDVRALTLGEGELRLRFGDVAEQIQPETVSLRSLTEAGSVVILEQNYEYDLMSPQKLMEKYVGREVLLKNFSTRLNVGDVTATLLSVNGGTVYQVGSDIYLGHPGQVVLPELPDELIAEPSLIWTIQNTSEEQRVEASYLTGGIGWKADYVVTLAKGDASLELASWVTLNNNSGATYTNARLKVVAGEVNRVMGHDAMQSLGFIESRGRSADMAVEEAFGEYHLYSIPRRVTIKNNASKQVALLSGSDVASMKRYEYRGNLQYYSAQFNEFGPDHVSVYLDFENEETNGLGVPLPAGVMRVYQEDSEGALQFLGEDRIDHTPKNETVQLRLGSAFDVVAERVQKDFHVLGSSVFETSYEIVLRNHKDSDIVVDVVEPMPGDWDILSESLAHEKRDARTAVFSVPVAADGETTLSYRVRVRY